MSPTVRVGQIVPSSNTTMETEVPAMLRAREAVAPERFTFHSSRMRMKRVTADELAAMDADSDRCAVELADARVDVMAYACLVAIMAAGPGYHARAADRLTRRDADEGGSAPVVTSAGALLAGLRRLDAATIAIVTPYVRDLTRLVASYLEDEGFRVADAISLEIADNVAVGRRPAEALVDIAQRLDLTGVDTIVLSACVQKPSLRAIEPVQQATGLPVVTASACTVHAILRELGLPTFVPGAGALLDGTR
jgi:maleate isomerase